MDLSRRDFVRISAGTALGGLVGLGAKLDATGAATFERELGYCPLDPAPDGSQLTVIDIAAHWDGSAYCAIPDVPLGEATFLPDPADPSSAFTSAIGAGIVTVNRGVIPMSV